MNTDAIDASLRRTFEKFRRFMGHSGVGKLFEDILESFYRGILSPGDCAIDVGANFGLHTIPMANAVGPGGRVLAFEPIPHVHDALATTIKTGGKTKIVELHQVALSDHSGQAEFNVVVANVGYSGLKEKPYPFDTEKQLIQVKIERLDEFAAHLDSVAFIKVDVEGGEFPVLRGAAKILKTHRPVIVFESAKEESARSYEYTAEELFAFFAGLDYELRDIFGCPFVIEHWNVFCPWYVVAYPKEQAATIPSVLATAVAEHSIGFAW